MAGTLSDQFDNPRRLSPNQQDLLLAALSSNDPNGSPGFTGQSAPPYSSTGYQFRDAIFDKLDTGLISGAYGVSTQDIPRPDNLNGFALEDSNLDALSDGDGNIDFDDIDEDLTINGLPAVDLETLTPGEHDGGVQHKRKSIGDHLDEVEVGNKKREGEDKTAKKPGRKPLTSEPTTKRKAQNRAAQRAFRERKEKHLKDLEDKVGELEQQSKAVNDENGLLRAQVSRLQAEVQSYRKKMALDNSSVNRPSAMTSKFGSFPGGAGDANNFQFEFPRFGDLPGSQVFGHGLLGKPSTSTTSNNANFNGQSAVLARQDLPRTLSPTSQTGGENGVSLSPRQNDSSPSYFRANSVQSTSSPSRWDGAETFTGIPSPSNRNTVGASTVDYNATSNARDTPGSLEGIAAPARVFRFNSTSVSNADSPSASSVSQYGGQSSCATSPAPSHSSPSAGKYGAEISNPIDAINPSRASKSNTDGELTFCDKLNMACGNYKNPIPRALSDPFQSDLKPATTSTTAENPNIDLLSTTPTPGMSSIDWLSSQNGGQFDPYLLGDYRESQAAIVGTGEDFTNGFFDEALPYVDLSSPFNFDTTNTTSTPMVAQKADPIDIVDKIRDGEDEDDDEIVPGEEPGKLLSCHNIWDELQNRPAFKEGSIDIDNLCSELRAKARCSESGVVLDRKDVDAALNRLPGQQTKS